jgi:hypothetical protein
MKKMKAITTKSGIRMMPDQIIKLKTLGCAQA